MVQVQQLLMQNDKADTNTKGFKQAVTKFKWEFKTLPTTWGVKFFLPFEEGAKKKKPTALKSKTDELVERQYDMAAYVSRKLN